MLSEAKNPNASEMLHLVQHDTLETYEIQKTRKLNQ